MTRRQRRQRDGLARALPVGLRPRDGEQQTAGAPLQVPDVDADELRAAQRSGEPDEQQRPVPCAGEGVRVEHVDEARDVVVDQRGLRRGRAFALGRADAGQHLAHGERVVRGRVSEAEVHEPQRGQAPGEGARRETAVGPVREERGDRVGLGGQGAHARVGAPGLERPPVPVVGASRRLAVATVGVSARGVQSRREGSRRGDERRTRTGAIGHGRPEWPGVLAPVALCRAVVRHR